MIKSFFGTPDERVFRKMGYFGDQAGIMRRYRREQEHWDTHLQNTRQFAVRAMQGKNHQTAAVLGSGWLLDVPINELTRYFEKVYLYDIQHPAAVKKQVQSLDNVELCVCDISNFAHAVYEYTKQYRNCKQRPPINMIQPQMKLDLSGFDFVFSCNILNQLDILLVDYLAQFFELSDEEITAFRKNIQQHHIDLLPPNRSCIVADYEEIVYTLNGKEISRKISIYHPITQCPAAERWVWEFDTCMTYYRGKKTFFKVMGTEV